MVAIGKAWFFFNNCPSLRGSVCVCLWMSWGYEVNYHSSQKPTARKFIQTYDPQVDRAVWLEWNGNLKAPRVHRWNEEAKRLWWMEWEISGHEKQADEIPSVQPYPGCTHSANYVPVEEEPQRKRKK